MSTLDINFEYISEPETWSQDVISFLTKWGLGKLKKLSFRFNEVVKEYQHKDLLIQLFKSSALLDNLEIVDKMGSTTRLNSTVADVDATILESTVVSLSFFEPLHTRQGIIRSSGTIQKCFEENMNGYLCQNMLQRILVDEEDTTFSAEEKSEFIYKIFYHLVLGGGLCQFEEKLEPYLDVTKLLYKDMVRVHSREDRLEVASIVFAINGLLDSQSNPIQLFPDTDELPIARNILYISFDPYLRHVNVLYCPFENAW